MSYALTNSVSTFVDSQLSEFIREDSPKFSQFLQAYYAWMEQANNDIGGIIYNSKNLLSYHDIDNTSDQFLQYFINDFLPYFPNITALDERKLIKVARQFYQKKGSIESIQFLFRVLYNKEANIYYPKQNILKASDGKWNTPQGLRLSISNTIAQTYGSDITIDNTAITIDSIKYTIDNQFLIVYTPTIPNFDFSLLVGRYGYGSISNAVCVIESAQLAVDPILGLTIVEIFISGVNKPFVSSEKLNIPYGVDANGNSLVFSQQIIASISNININPKNRGLKYKGISLSPSGIVIYPGDPVSIIGGVNLNSPQSKKAIAYVGNVTTGSISSVNVISRGYNYMSSPSTLITIINDPSDTTGAGSNIIVQAIDTDNAIYKLINTDCIEYRANAKISALDYAFANAYAFGFTANQSTILYQAFSYANLQFAPLLGLNVVNQGGGYSAPPSIQLQDTYETDLVENLIEALDFSDAANDIQYIDDLGFIAAVGIINGGNNYSNVTDKIYAPTAIGYNSDFSFITNPSGTIISVNVTNQGEGYIGLPLPLLVANSANLQNISVGTGAQLEAYGYGQGANLTLSVNKIGSILDIRLENGGFDYNSTPNISLRIQDLITNPVSNSVSFITDEVIYQGSNITPSYLAFIDSYDISNSRLRVYNYQGTLDAALSLTTVNSAIITSINTNSSSNITTYGDGKAKANATFLNGLINYPGYYLDTSGFLSADQYLQDSNTYHNYSYIVSVDQGLASYKNALTQLAHPAGMSMLGKYGIETDNQEKVVVDGGVSVLPPITGVVFVNAFDSNYILIGSGSGNTVINSFFQTATANQTVFDTVEQVANNIYSIITKNGLLQVPTFQYNEANDIFTFTANCRAGDIIEFKLFSGTSNSVNLGSDYFIATINQNTFTMTANVLDEEYILATKNGLLQIPVTDYQLISNNIVQFSSNCRFNDIVEFRSFTGNIGILGNVNIISQVFTPNTPESIFILEDMVTDSNTVIVSINGLIQVPNYQYIVQDGELLTLAANSQNGDIIECRLFTGFVGTGPGTNFLNTASNGDLITFNTNDSSRPEFTKIIETVISDGILILESNTQFPFNSLVSVTSGSNVISSNETFVGTVDITDVVMMNVAGSLMTSIVLTTPIGNTLTVNTVFNSNSTNLVMLVYPSINSVSYTITNKQT